MSKMGISTFTSYHGSMLLHSIGLGKNLSDQYFPSLPSFFSGLELSHIESQLYEKIESFSTGDKLKSLNELGLFRFRKGGELHGFNPTRFKKNTFNKCTEK